MRENRLWLGKVVAFACLTLLLLVSFQRYHSYGNYVARGAELRQERSEFEEGRPRTEGAEPGKEALAEYRKAREEFAKQREAKEKDWRERQKEVDRLRTSWLKGGSAHVVLHLLLGLGLLAGLALVALHGSEVESAAAIFLAVVLVPRVTQAVFPLVGLGGEF